MKNKLIFLIVVFVILFGLILIITNNRKSRERVFIEENIRKERQQFVEDSLQNIQEKTDRTKITLSKEGNANNEVGNSNTQIEDFSSYLNASITNTSRIDIAVIIIDESGSISSSMSSSIASIYSQSGNNGNSGLIRSAFISRTAFKELMEGNSEIIQKMKVINYTDYIAIGKVSYSLKRGTLVDGTFVCTTSLSMRIISANNKSLVKSFICSANGNGATENQAKEYAIDKLLSKYKSEYSSI